ncbi:MAG: low affinity iron permease family protein [Pseudolabrys sp.]
MNRNNGHDENHSDSGGPSPLATHFAKFAQATSMWSGHPVAFLLALTVVIVWVVTGPVFNYSDTWQLVINTGTTIITFLMVFLIQNTQNRDMMAVQLKLSELVLAMKGAENKFASIEDLTDDELKKLHDECRARVEFTLRHLESRQAASRRGPSAPIQHAKSNRRSTARAAKS